MRTRMLVFLGVLLALGACQSEEKKPTAGPVRQAAAQAIRQARVIDKNTIDVSFRVFLDEALEAKDKWNLTEGLTIAEVKNVPRGGKRTANYRIKVSPEVKPGITYRLKVGELRPFAVDSADYSRKVQDDFFNQFVSTKPMGMTEEGDALVFRVFVPRGEKVMLCLFKKDNLETPYKEIEMQKDKDMVWETRLTGKKQYEYQLYGYRIFGPESPYEHFSSKIVIADPYAKATAQSTEFPMKSRSVILPSSMTHEYKWDAKVPKWTNLKTRDAVIYEVHVRDITMHPTSGIDQKTKGTYLGFIKKLPYLKSIGVNAVELLPVHDIGNAEPPFLEKATSANGALINNNWNAYGWNHWGYMNSSYFAVESMYATGATKEAGKWNGVDGRHLVEFKQLVEACHREGISVIMDVVFNHVSQYCENPFKFIDYTYYFEPNSKSGCGNDFKTDRPMSKRVISDSVNYFVDECRVDGYRFDLAGLIVHETSVALTESVKKIHPNVILIAEPWGGRYCPEDYSKIGWASWNDRFRNNIKGGDNNASGTGGSFIYGKSAGASVRGNIMGTLKKNGGLFEDMAHAINYVAGHDNHALGDHIRINTGRIKPEGKVDPAKIDEIAKLNEREMQINKLAAFMLYTSQGGIMILAGQEWAQAKVTFPPEKEYPKYGDTKPWTLDHNSYEKDNETNWLNFKHMEMNKALVDYYAGMARLRAKYNELRWAEEKDVTWLSAPGNNNAIGWVITKGTTVIALANPNATAAASFTLPAGEWKIVVNGEKAGTETIATASGTVSVPAASGMVLVK